MVSILNLRNMVWWTPREVWKSISQHWASGLVFHIPHSDEACQCLQNLSPHGEGSRCETDLCSSHKRPRYVKQASGSRCEFHRNDIRDLFLMKCWGLILSPFTWWILGRENVCSGVMFCVGREAEMDCTLVLRENQRLFWWCWLERQSGLAENVTIANDSKTAGRLLPTQSSTTAQRKRIFTVCNVIRPFICKFYLH